MARAFVVARLSHFDPGSNLRMNAPYPYSIPQASVPAQRELWALRLTLVAASFGLFLVACLLPALVLRGVDEAWPGYGVLFFGWMGVAAGQIGWLANLDHGLAPPLVVFRRYVAAAVVAAVACVVALQTLMLFFSEIPADEVRVATHHLVTLRVGFHYWMPALVAALAGSIALAVTDRRR